MQDGKTGGICIPPSASPGSAAILNKRSPQNPVLSKQKAVLSDRLLIIVCRADQSLIRCSSQGMLLRNLGISRVFPPFMAESSESRATAVHSQA